MPLCRAVPASGQRTPANAAKPAPGGPGLRAFLLPVTNSDPNVAAPQQQPSPEEVLVLSPPPPVDEDVVFVDAPQLQAVAEPVEPEVVADEPDSDSPPLRRRSSRANQNRIVVIDSDSDGGGAAADVIEEAAHEEEDGPPTKRRATRSAAGNDGGDTTAFFLKPAEKKQKQRMTKEQKEAAAAQEAAAAAARAREDAVAALRRDRAEARQKDQTWNQGRSVHQFFALNARPAALAPASGDAQPANGDAAAQQNVAWAAPMPPPWMPVHVGLPPQPVPGVASPMWPPGMLCEADALQEQVHAADGHWTGLLAPPAPAEEDSPATPDGEHQTAVVDAAIALEALDAYLQRHAPAVVATDTTAMGMVDDDDDDALCISQPPTKEQRLQALLDKLASLTQQHGAQCDDGGSANALWCSRYAPQCADGVLCSGGGVSALHQWLAAWKAAASGDGQGAGDLDEEDADESPPESMSPQPPGRASKRRRPADYGDFVGESSDDFIDDGEEDEEEEEDGNRARARMPHPAFVLSGPPGCGKTAGVYAVAAELGFTIIEVGANAPRAGADVLSRFGEATQSRRVQQQTVASMAPLTLTGAIHTAKGAQRKPGGAKPGRRARVLDDNSSSDDDVEAVAPQAAFVTVDKQQSIILFDEADLLWAQDRGFAAAMAQLTTGAKRPLVLTVNDASAVLHALPTALTRHHAVGRPAWGPDWDAAVVHLSLMALAEGRQCDPQLADSILSACEGDMRAAVARLQVYSLPVHGKQSNGGRHLVDSTERDDELHAWRHVANNHDVHGTLCVAVARAVLDATVLKLHAAADAHSTALASIAAAAQESREAEQRAIKVAKRARRLADLGLAAEEPGEQDDGGASQGRAPDVAEPPPVQGGAEEPQEAPIAEEEMPPPPITEPEDVPMVSKPHEALVATAEPSTREHLRRQVALLAGLADMSARLSDAAAMRYPVVVTCTGPRRVRPPSIQSAMDDESLLPPEMRHDASSAESGADGGQPRSQLGGGAGTAELCGDCITALAVRLARLEVTPHLPAGMDTASPPPPVAVSVDTLERPLARLENARDLVAQLASSLRGMLAAGEGVMQTVAFAGRMARLESAGAKPKARGRRRRLQTRGKHITCEEELLNELLRQTEFAGPHER